MDLSQIQLIYRAEGNANLVLYLPQQKKVLRLPKCVKSLSPKRTSPSSPTAAEEAAAAAAATAITSIGKNILGSGDHMAYIAFMEHLLGTEYITKPEVVSISSVERDKINRFCAPFRPAVRLDKEFCGQFGLLFPDATYFPDIIDSANIEVMPGDTFAIEIKPKQGWMLQDILPSSCGDLFDLKGSRRCRFCCMQFSKLKCHKIKKTSTYCPMDLFSGNFERMNKALDGLFQYPQNNLRVFENGELYYGDQNDLSFQQFRNQFFNGQFELLKKLIIKSILKSSNDKNIDDSMKLPIGCVLEKVLQLQLLSKKNIDFMALESNIKENSYNYLKSLIDKIGISHVNDLNQLEEYMVGATALDCSIMVTFKEIGNLEIFKPEKMFKILNIDKRHFITNITILDIDPKPDNHFHKFVMKTNQAYLDASNFC